MIKDNIKSLLFLILVVIVLLAICVAVDSAEEITVSNVDCKNVSVNDSFVNLNSDYDSNITVSARDTVHQMYPTVSMYAKPSCGCRYSYTWHKYTFINYCPHCHKYGVLKKNPKGVYEREYTCAVDDCDYCAVCGKEKYSWSRFYLRKC